MFFFADPPVVISPPHFYLGNESLVKAVTGLHPNKRLHQTFVDIEPVRGDILCSCSSVVLLGYWGGGGEDHAVAWVMSRGESDGSRVTEKETKKKEED